jgi:ferredoxin
MSTTPTIRLPLPHIKQQAIKRAPAKRVVVCAGRRAGKTTLAAVVAVEKLAEGRRVLLSSTTQEQADAFWDKAKSWCREAIDAGIIEKNEQRRILSMAATGGRIKVKTASDADTLRGDYADFLVLDECALLAPDAWDKVGAPMLLDNDGDAWFISTPRRRNWFFHLFQKAETGDDPRWAAFHFTSLDNPHLSRAALDDIIGDLTEDAYQQEILAEFLPEDGAVFRNVRACLKARTDATYADHQGHRLVMGCDWAQIHDFTCLSVFCATCAVEVELDRFNQIDWAFQRKRVASLVSAWRVKSGLAELNSIGSPNVEALQAEGLPLEGFQTTATSKPILIQSLALAFEREEAQWLPIPVATAELEAYEATVSAQTGRVRYGAPEGMHDDTVIARALAWKAATNAATGFVYHYDTRYQPQER